MLARFKLARNLREFSTEERLCSTQEDKVKDKRRCKKAKGSIMFDVMVLVHIHGALHA